MTTKHKKKSKKKGRCPPKDRGPAKLGPFPETDDPYDNNPGPTPKKKVPYDGD